MLEPSQNRQKCDPGGSPRGLVTAAVLGDIWWLSFDVDEERMVLESS